MKMTSGFILSRSSPCDVPRKVRLVAEFPAASSECHFDQPRESNIATQGTHHAA
jgi:hypothetical protein